MRKLTIGLVVVAIMTAAVVSLVPALCANGGANGNTCDLTAVLRGSLRLINAETCRHTPTAAGCQVASLAGLKK